MHTIAFSSLTGFISQKTVCSTETPVDDAVRPELAGRLEVERRAMRRITAIVLTVLLDITLVLWVCPIANQLAEWAGVSLLNAVYVGLGAMLGSIPVVVAVTILLWLRKGARQVAAAE
jgi:hypothetical protein